MFIRTFGDTPLVRILDFLIYSRDFDYPLTEIAENADVHYQTLKKVWRRLEKATIVTETRVLSGSTLYRLNLSNPAVQKLIELNEALCWQEVPREEPASV